MHDLIAKWSVNERGTLLACIIFFAVAIVCGALFIQRDQFIILIAWQILLHVIYLLIYRLRKSLEFGHLILFAMIIRVCIACIMPGLSEDVYRFVWDGHLILNGVNPMLSTPDSFLASVPKIGPDYLFYENLHGLINHPQYYTCYPPMVQVVSWLAAFLGTHSVVANVVIIKLILALADGATIFFLAKILKKLNVSRSFVILYAFHPLIIIEGAGNAHFEVLQAAFMSAAIYFVMCKRMVTAAAMWGLAISTKLLPLLLLPLWWQYLGIKKGLQFCIISIGIFFVAFLPFLSWQTIDTYSQTIGLFIRQFEFNASLYYVAREIGYLLTGHNQVAFIGPLLLLLFLVAYTSIMFRSKIKDFRHFAYVALILYSLYLFCATTVHPWYIITLLPFAVIAGRMYAFIWMSAAFLSYSAYASPVTTENPWLVALEYITVLIAFFFGQQKTPTNSSPWPISNRNPYK